MELAEIFILPSQGAIVLDKLEPERLFDAHDVLKYLGGFVVVLYTVSMSAWRTSLSRST